MRAPSTRSRALAALLLSTLALGACSKHSEEAAPASETSAASTTSETSSSSSSATSSSETSSETSSEESSSSSATPTSTAEWLDYVRTTFGSLAPSSLFDSFDSCEPAGVPDTVACSGSKVGQFQFSTGTSKALQTVQTLTQLRSSHVVEDNGSRVVGWSTVGNASIITVVDSDKGIIAQQLISSDKMDPEQRIAELGLSDKPQPKETSSSNSTTETATSTTTTSR
ncbi:MAG: hypothetical protein Q3962_02350 [Corynebacterium sp.]|nr:hypothetical protein [Corynebacterium sp.]